MKRLNNIFTIAAMAFLLTGCSVFKEMKDLHGIYEAQTDIPNNVYGTSKDIKEASGNG